MIKLLLFETKKIIRSTFFLVMLSGLALFVAGYFTFVHIQMMTIEDVIEAQEINMTVSLNALESIEEEIAAEELDEEDEQVKRDREYWEEDKGRHETLLQYYEEENWQGVMSQHIEQNEEHVESRLFRANWASAEWMTLFSDVTKLEHDKWLYERDIRPVFPVHDFSWMTSYDYYFQDPHMEEAVRNWANKYSSSGVYFLNHFTELSFSVIGVLFFLFLFGDVMTREGLRSNGSIHLLRTQPLKRRNILISKFLTVIAITLLILVGIVVFVLLLGTIFHYIGDWEYPVLIYGEDYGFTFINMGTYLLQSFTLFFMLLLFTYSLLFFFSILTKRNLVAVGLTLVVLFIGIEVSEQTILSPLAPYVPFHYFQVSDIITQEFALEAGNFLFTFENGLFILGVSTLILLFATAAYSMIEYRYFRT